MDEPDPKLVVLRFNERINARDIEGLVALMTEDHVFIDSADGRTEGRERAGNAWRGFFAAFPDYRNSFSALVSRGDRVYIAGRSSCSNPLLDGPALWMASIRGEEVAAWRVCDDTPETRRQLGLAGID